MTGSHGLDCYSCDVWTDAEQQERPVCTLAESHLLNIQRLLSRWHDELIAGGFPAWSGWAARDYEASEASLEQWQEIVADEIGRRKEAGTWQQLNLGGWQR